MSGVLQILFLNSRHIKKFNIYLSINCFESVKTRQPAAPKVQSTDRFSLIIMKQRSSIPGSAIDNFKVTDRF